MFSCHSIQAVWEAKSVLRSSV